MNSNQKKFLFLILIFSCSAYNGFSQEWKLQSTVFSTVQFVEYPFIDSGWFDGTAGGLKVPLEFQIGIFRINSTLVSINTGLSIGVLPASQGFYSGATIGIGLHYNNQLQGFFSAVYPMFDVLWLEETYKKREADWQAAVDILGFDFDLAPLLPVQLGVFLRCAVAWNSGVAIPAIEAGITIGYHFIK